MELDHPKIWKFEISFKWTYLKCQMSNVEPRLGGTLWVSDIMVI
jgi:hypothetical protein